MQHNNGGNISYIMLRPLEHKACLTIALNDSSSYFHLINSGQTCHYMLTEIYWLCLVGVAFIRHNYSAKRRGGECTRVLYMYVFIRKHLNCFPFHPLI